MFVFSESFFYVPVIVNSRMFENYWKLDGLFLKSWEGNPLDRWFLKSSSGEKIGFFAGLASFDHKRVISFTNGRHRTRWLIDSGLECIPVCIPPSELDLWVESDLIAEMRQPIKYEPLVAYAN